MRHVVFVSSYQPHANKSIFSTAPIKDQALSRLGVLFLLFAKLNISGGEGGAALVEDHPEVEHNSSDYFLATMFREIGQLLGRQILWNLRYITTSASRKWVVINDV
jgi:hypothetical protein